MSKENTELALSIFQKVDAKEFNALQVIFDELHLRREIERMADKVRERCIYVCDGLVYKEGHYYYKQYISTGHGEQENLQGPYTLQQCHDKLREISGEE